MWQTAKQLRRRMTAEERALWEQLRAERLAGFHFRRQQVIGRYIVDFYCHPAGLVIELDGMTHSRQVDHDYERDAILAAQGLEILRFKNEQIRNNLAQVLKQIEEAYQAQQRDLM